MALQRRPLLREDLLSGDRLAAYAASFAALLRALRPGELWGAPRVLDLLGADPRRAVWRCGAAPEPGAATGCDPGDEEEAERLAGGGGSASARAEALRDLHFRLHRAAQGKA